MENKKTKSEQVSKLKEQMQSLSDDLKQKEEQNEILLKANQELKNKITSLNAKIGGYKSSNELFKKRSVETKQNEKELNELRKTHDALLNEIETLKKETCELKDKLAKATDYANEADLLNEEKSQRIITLKDKLEKQEKRTNELNEMNDVLSRNHDFYKANYEYIMSLPWYKRVFVKK